jgi:hypothetical protein
MTAANFKQFIRRWLRVTLSRPLTLQEGAAVGLALLVAGTIYCQIYCLLALQQMHGASMSIWSSVHRASVDVVPAFAVFEIGKRMPVRTRWWGWIMLLGAVAAAVAFATLWRLQLHLMTSGLSARRIAVDRIPFMAVAVAGIAFYQTLGRVGRPEAGEAADNGPEQLPPAGAIDWVRAAGNYVEVHFNGRSRLLRMTLHHARQTLPSRDFVQIHRSVVVNKNRISNVDGRLRTVRLADGSTLNVGETYRANLRASRSVANNS